MSLCYKASPFSSSPSFSNVPTSSSSSCEQSNSSPQEKGLLLAPYSLSNQELVFLRLLKTRLISLSPCTHNKFPKNDSFCAYHQLLGHSTSKCKALNEKIQQLHQLGVIDISCIDMPSCSPFHRK